MKKITCMIVEDEPHAMQLLEDHIARISFLELSGKCFDAMDALNFLSVHTVDVIFLDINMPLLSGIEMASMISKEQRIIFTTAYSEYAIDSFDYHVIDYLLKPITFKRFIQAVNKLQGLVNKDAAERETEINEAALVIDRQVESIQGPSYLFVKSGKQIHKIAYASIHYIEALKEYIAIHTDDGKLLVYKRMKDVAESLPAQFVRIHNSYIVNVEHIQCIDSGLVEIKGSRLPVSNSYRELFNRKISGSLL